MTAITIESVDLVAVPFSGLVLKNGESVVMMANILPETYVVREGEPKWYYQQLNEDGSWGEWTSFGSSASGVLYQHVTSASGIFRVKTVLSEEGFVLEKQFLRTNDDAFSNLKKGDPDAFGVVDTESQRTIRITACAESGSTYYAENGGLPAWRDPRGLFLTWPKCNVFVADMCDAAGANVDPPVGGVYLSGPPSANRWAGMPDVNDPGAPYPIPDWTLLPLNTKPQPGFVVASGYETNRSGHCGIVDYDGRWISAGHDNVTRTAEFSDRNYWRHYESGVTAPPGLRAYAP